MNKYKDMEFEVNILDMFKTVFRKWKMLIVCLLVGALIGGGISLYKINSLDSIDSEEELKSLKSSLSAEEIRDVESVADIILRYKDMYNQQEEYNKNSIFQKLDPYSTETLQLTYFVDNHYSISYPIIEENNDLLSIVQTYCSVLYDEELYKKMAEEIDDSIDPTYYSEMVKVGDDFDQQKNGVFIVTIYADTTEHLSLINDFIKEDLEDVTKNIEKSYGDIDLILTSEVRLKTINPDIAEQQQENISTLVDISKSITEQEDKFSGDKLTYLKTLVHDKEEENIPVLLYVVMCSFAGALFCVIYSVTRYITSNTIKTSEEIENIFNLELLDVLDSMNENWSNSVIIEKLEYKSKHRGYKKILISFNDGGILETLASTINVVNINCINDLLNDSGNISLLEESDAVVLVIKLKETNRKHIAKEIELCEAYDSPIIGAIVLS